MNYKTICWHKNNLDFCLILLFFLVLAEVFLKLALHRLVRYRWHGDTIVTHFCKMFKRKTWIQEALLSITTYRLWNWKMRISVAVFQNLHFYFIFKRRPNQLHDLKFPQKILLKKKKNHRHFRSVAFWVNNKIWQEVCDTANRNIHFCSFTIAMFFKISSRDKSSPENSQKKSKYWDTWASNDTLKWRSQQGIDTKVNFQ